MKNQSEVGDLLAAQLTPYANKPDVIVLAAPRSGVLLGARVAAKLNAPLDVFLVRKLGWPDRPSLPMGVIASGGVRILRHDIINSLRIDDEVVEEVTAREQDDLARQEYCYRQTRPPAEIHGKTVILVTDSITTGATAAAAVETLRQLRAKRIVVAAPTIARPAYNRLRAMADGVAAVVVPEEFFGVRQWHHDFSGTTEVEVQELLAETNHWLAEAAA